ncbi:cellulose binding domain-containing protein [Spirillospora sp. CA-253888]
MNETAEHGPDDSSRPRGGRRRRPKPSLGERVVRRPVVLAVVGGGMLLVGATALTLQAGGDDGNGPKAASDCADGCAVTPATSGDPAGETSTREVEVPPREVNAASSSKPTGTASPSASPSTSPSKGTSPGASPSPSATPSRGGGRDGGRDRDRDGGRDDRDDDRHDGGGRHDGDRRPSGDRSALRAFYSTSHSWGSGYIGSLTVVNRGSSPVSSWRLSAYFSGAEITAAWSNSGSAYSDHGYNRLSGSGGTLAPGDSVTVGFEARGYPGAPSYCNLNGRSCWG